MTEHNKGMAEHQCGNVCWVLIIKQSFALSETVKQGARKMGKIRGNGLRLISDKISSKERQR